MLLLKYFTALHIYDIIYTLYVIIFLFQKTKYHTNSFNTFTNRKHTSQTDTQPLGNGRTTDRQPRRIVRQK